MTLNMKNYKGYNKQPYCNALVNPLLTVGPVELVSKVTFHTFFSDA